MERTKVQLCMALALMMISQTAIARNYYASPNGTGDGSSIDRPIAIGSIIYHLTFKDTLFIVSPQYQPEMHKSHNWRLFVEPIAFVGQGKKLPPRTINRCPDRNQFPKRKEAYRFMDTRLKSQLFE